MRFSAVLAFGLATFAMASPVPEAEAEAGVVDSITGALPHAISAADKRAIAEALANKIMTDAAPVNLVSRQANNTAAAAPAAAKKAKKGKSCQSSVNLQN